MALTFALDPLQAENKRRVAGGTVTFDSSYTTGGMSFTFRQIGLDFADTVMIEAASGYLLAWNKSTTAPTFIAYQQSAATGALTQVPAATDLSAVAAEFRAVGY
jgi:hypothetical protein